MCAGIPEIAPKLQAPAVRDSLSCSKFSDYMTFVGRRSWLSCWAFCTFVRTDASFTANTAQIMSLVLPRLFMLN